MIAAQSAHPAKDQLIAFGQGKLADDESSRIEQHLELCRECCETLLDLKDDTFTGLVRHAKQIAAADAPGTGDRPVVSPPETDQATDGHVAGPASQAATLLPQSTETVSGCEVPAELRDHPRYRVVELIGQGGMGAVYRAEHRLMNRAVAIKLINAQLVQHPQAVERFRREVQAAAKLSHPNIVAAYDAEQAGSAHFLVMEFVDGTDLATVIEQRGPMSVAEACECIRQAAAGLQHAHEKGMVHRDIKPHNLMLAAGGQVRILDFGLAGFTLECGGSTPLFLASEPLALASTSVRDPIQGKESGSAAIQSGVEPPHSKAHLTALGSVMGTPDYMAPEQAADAHSADVRADIYSLGCTLHFLLTGKPPFEATDVVAKLMAHVDQPPPDLAARCQDVPAELSAVVARMMAKDPAERFQTPAEVADALRPFAKPVSLPPRRRRKSLLAAALAGAAMLLAGIIVIATDRGRLEIQSEVNDVQVVVEQGGEQVAIVDLKTGSQVKWLKTGKYELKLKGGDQNDITLDQRGFTMSRLGKVIVTARWNTEHRTVIRAFTMADTPITSPTVSGDFDIDHDGWRIKAFETRTVRLFEAPLPPLASGPFFYRAKLKTENVKGRAYLEMWVRFPGEGEFFSKGFHNAISGTNGWAEYEIPFFLKKGQQPDLAKLNLTIEGSGTVWIKDIQLRRGQVVPEEAASEKVKVGNLISNPGFEDSADPNGRQPAHWMAERSTLATEPEADCYRDTQTKYRGAASGAVVKHQSNSDAPEAGFVQRIAGLPTGQNLRLSGYLKTKDLQGAAYLVLRIIDPQRGPVSVAWCATPLVKGTTDWQQYEAYIRTPDRADGMLGLVMRGKGTVWFDDISLEIASQQTKPEPNDSGQPDSQLTPHARLQGKWVAVSGHARKQPIPAEQLKQMSITFDGDQVTFDQPGAPPGSQRGTFKINPNSNPKQITLVAPDPKKETLPGIYEFDGERLKLALIDEDYARPTNFEPDDRPDHMTLVLERAPLTGPALGPVEREALKAAQEFLAVMDEGKFGQLFDMSASWAKRSTTREKTSQTHQTIRDSFGKAIHRTLHRAHLLDRAPQLPEGRYAGVQYKSRFERQEVLWETVLLNVEPDGKWRVNTYAWTLEEPTLPEPQQAGDDPATTQKKQAARAAADEWLKLVDAGNYGESWDTSAASNKQGIGKQKMSDVYQELFRALGPMKSREFKSSEYRTQLPGAPAGEYGVIQFNTQFAKQRVVETVVLTKEDDGQWRVSGYFHADAPSAPTPPPSTSKPPQRKTGVLTNPPKLPPKEFPSGAT